MKKIILKDFEKWKLLNKENDFSLFDYIFHVTQKEGIKSDLFFAFLELFWPTFVSYEDYLFINVNFSRNKVIEFVKDKKNVEYWVNLLLVDAYFGDTKQEEVKMISFIQSLSEIWKIKLLRDFPDKQFIIEPIFDSECGDYGLTFYQNKYLST